jgi:hypothetical protein
MLQTPGKHLLVRADFVLGKVPVGERRTLKRWRRILAAALPQLMGCADRCPKAARLRLRSGEGEARFTGWLRIPVQRRPGRKRLRRFKAQLRTRLEASLAPIDGRVVKVGVRRYRAVPALPVEAAPTTPLPYPVETAQSA